MFGLARTRSAAKQVANAIADVRDRLLKDRAITDVNHLISEMEEFRELYKSQNWGALPRRCSSIRRHLMELKSTLSGMPRSQKSKLQGMIQQFDEIEGIIEAILSGKKAPDEIGDVSMIVKKQSDKLVDILISVRQNIGALT